MKGEGHRMKDEHVDAWPTLVKLEPRRERSVCGVWLGVAGPGGRGMTHENPPPMTASNAHD